MKISIRKNGGRHFTICVPTGILLNRFTALFIPKILEAEDITLTPAQVVKISQGLRVCRRRHKDWKLIEAHTADGEYVEISI